MVYVGLASNRRGSFIMEQPVDSPPERGLESTRDLDSAKRFSDAGEIGSWVTARGGDPGAWIAWQLP